MFLYIFKTTYFFADIPVRGHSGPLQPLRSGLAIAAAATLHLCQRWVNDNCQTGIALSM